MKSISTVTGLVLALMFSLQSIAQTEVSSDKEVRCELTIMKDRNSKDAVRTPLETKYKKNSDALLLVRSEDVTASVNIRGSKIAFNLTIGDDLNAHRFSSEAMFAKEDDVELASVTYITGLNSEDETIKKLVYVSCVR